MKTNILLRFSSQHSCRLPSTSLCFVRVHMNVVPRSTKNTNGETEN